MDTTTPTTLLDEVRALAPGFGWHAHDDYDDVQVTTSGGFHLSIGRCGRGYRSYAATTSEHPIYVAGSTVIIEHGTHPTIESAVRSAVKAYTNRHKLLVIALRAALAVAEGQVSRAATQDAPPDDGVSLVQA